jgi:AMP nucleosidase
MQDDAQTDTLTPDAAESESFSDAAAAVDRLEALYTQATSFLVAQFQATITKGNPGHRVRAFYPEIRLTVTSFDKVDSRLSFGHVSSPGTYATTVTRPDLFRHYLIQQIELLVQNHGVTVQIGPSDTPIPVHFAVTANTGVAVPQDGVMDFSCAMSSTCRTLPPPTMTS